MTLPRRTVQALLDAYTVLVLILSTNAFLTLLIGGSDAARASSGSPFFRIAWAFVYTITLLRALRQHSAFMSLVRTNKALLYFILFAFVSALWSIDPAATFHGAVILLFTTLFTMDLCLRYSMGKQIKLVFTALVLVVALSVIVEIFLSGFIPGVDLEEAAWHGVFGTKNEFARVVAIALATCLALLQPIWSKVLAVVVGVCLAVLARSIGGLAYLSAIVALSIWLPVLRWRLKPRRLALFATAIIVFPMLCFAGINFAKLTALMGRDPHMTGRTTLWTLAIDDVQKRPILGYGYSAFWDQKSQPARLIREESNWEDAPHSHNGYIDLALGLGLAGLAFYAIIFCTGCRRAYLFFMSSEDSYKQWPLTYLALVTLYQLTESSIVTGDSLVWILYCSVLFSLSPITRQAPAQRMLATQQLAA